MKHIIFRSSAEDFQKLNDALAEIKSAHNHHLTKSTMLRKAIALFANDVAKGDLDRWV